MNSLGPNRRSWSTLTQTQDPPTRSFERNHNGVEASNKYKLHSSSPRKLQLRHIPLFLFSFATFLYIYMIQLHINITSRRHLNNSKTTSAKTGGSQPELIHIIQTRFMQHQPNLLSLGQARLELFQTFCLPSLQSQVNKNFLWIIRTDPNLHPTLRDKLVKLLKGHPNYILVGSNYNPEGFDREEDTFEQFLRNSNRNGSNVMSQVLSGNVTLLRESFSRSQRGAILLETRLDADDGLHRDFVKTVQSEARHLAEEGEGLWRIWCINYNIEWHPLDPFPSGGDKNKTGLEGFLVMYSDPNIW